MTDYARVVAAMNGVTRHQTDRVFPDRMFGGEPLRHRVHPLTCGNDSNHAPLFPFWNEEEQRMELWCRDCDYTQTNAAMFSVRKENLND